MDDITTRDLGQKQDDVAEWLPPFNAKLDAIAKAILDPTGPSVIRIIERGKRGRQTPIFFFARVKDIAEILGDDDHFSLSHYDDALAATAGDVRFILGVNDDDGDRKDKLAIIESVIGPKGRTTLTRATDLPAIARECTKRVTDSLLVRDRGEFNIIRDYGFFVPYLVTARFLGVWGPPSPNWLVRAFMLVRNDFARWRSDHQVEFTPEMAPCHVMLTWSHLIMGHIFGNFEGRDPFLRTAAGMAARQFNAHLTKLIEHPETIRFKDSLLAQFLAQREFFPDISIERYRALVRSILFEFAGSILILVGLSFCYILETLVRRNVRVEDFVRDISGSSAQEVIDEALRMNSTTAHLFRRAKKSVQVRGAVLRPGDYACLLVRHARADIAAYPSGDGMAPDPASPYLTFGPSSGSHACYGQFWARTILTEMFTGLTMLPGLKPADPAEVSAKTFAQLPDEFVWAYGGVAPEGG